MTRLRSSRLAPHALVIAGLACTMGATAPSPGAARSLVGVAGRRAPGPPNACALLTDAEVHEFAPKVGKGHPGHMGLPNISTCNWDNSHGIPALILTVSPADPSGVKAGLKSQLAPTGYTIVGVPALGDEAAAAVQQANPKYGIKPAVAILAVRVGHRQVSLSPTGITIVGPKSPGFRWLVHAAGLAAKRLGAAGG